LRLYQADNSPCFFLGSRFCFCPNQPNPAKPEQAEGAQYNVQFDPEPPHQQQKLKTKPGLSAKGAEPGFPCMRAVAWSLRDWPCGHMPGNH